MLIHGHLLTPYKTRAGCKIKRSLWPPFARQRPGHRPPSCPAYPPHTSRPPPAIFYHLTEPPHQPPAVARPPTSGTYPAPLTALRCLSSAAPPRGSPVSRPRRTGGGPEAWGPLRRGAPLGDGAGGRNGAAAAGPPPGEGGSERRRRGGSTGPLPARKGKKIDI